jgi:hypothetical protein
MLNTAHLALPDLTNQGKDTVFAFNLFSKNLKKVFPEKERNFEKQLVKIGSFLLTCSYALLISQAF